MQPLWRSIAQVNIVNLADNLFVFAFNSMAQRRAILRGGPWTVDNLETPYKIPLTTQEFWIQVKGLPLVLMTQAMGEEIERPLGTYITTDCNRGGDCLESAEDLGGIGCVQTVTVRDEDEVLGWQWGLGMGGFKKSGSGTTRAPLFQEEDTVAEGDRDSSGGNFEKFRVATYCCFIKALFDGCGALVVLGRVDRRLSPVAERDPEYEYDNGEDAKANSNGIIYFVTVDIHKEKDNIENVR
ncbi:hypothetical protein DVH24_006671 [Malus domestica]|uniref:DUF4283 domain-containing protein n=1 Tax=Malus domestica TaxID=3750 RepID=A0A498KG91_MALDO|nr:hypothetical protein DVH24_006671 [Malus domestica]